MAGITNFPTALDDNSSLIDVSDGVSSLQAAHHNNLKEAIKAIQSKVGINLTSDPASLDYRLGNATAGHRHDGASGQGAQIAATSIAGLGSYLAESQVPGFTPVAMIVERDIDFNATPNFVARLPFVNYYDKEWNTIAGIPTRMGIQVDSLNRFETLEAGVWAFQGGVNLNDNMASMGNKVVVSFDYPGAYNDSLTVPTTLTPNTRDFLIHRVFAAATGSIFGITVQNAHATTVATAVIGYAAFDLIRLSDRAE